MCINKNVPLYLNNDNEDLDFGMYNENHQIENEENISERNVRRIDLDLAAGRNKQRLMIASHKL